MRPARSASSCDSHGCSSDPSSAPGRCSAPGRALRRARVLRRARARLRGPATTWSAAAQSAAGRHCADRVAAARRSAHCRRAAVGTAGMPSSGPGAQGQRHPPRLTGTHCLARAFGPFPPNAAGRPGRCFPASPGSLPRRADQILALEVVIPAGKWHTFARQAGPASCPVGCWLRGALPPAEITRLPRWKWSPERRSGYRSHDLAQLLPPGTQ